MEYHLINVAHRLLWISRVSKRAADRCNIKMKITVVRGIKLRLAGTRFSFSPPQIPSEAETMKAEASS